MAEAFNKDEDDLLGDTEDERQSSSSSDSDEEEKDKAVIQRLQDSLSHNPYDYEAHIQYINALRKSGDVEKLQKSRESMSTLFPLSPKMWQEWAKDEACLNLSGPEAVSSVESLYERGINEYLSVPLWIDYLSFVQKQYDSVSKWASESIEKTRNLFERAITAVGLHVKDGGMAWAAYREFEQKVLINMTENNKEAKDRQIDRIRNLFRRQLAVPLANSKQILDEYRQWEEEQGNVIGNGTDDLFDLPSNVKSAYMKALQMYDARSYFEEMVEKEKQTDANRLQNYINYINFEECSGDPARVQVLYERAITEFPVAKYLWLKYTDYLDSNLKVPGIIRHVYARAIRNCPWVQKLWVKYILALERISASEEDISTVFEQSLQCSFTKSSEYADLFLVRADNLRRRIEKVEEMNSLYLKLLRDTFQRGAEYLVSQSDATDQLVYIHAYWTRLECHLAKDVAAARNIWEGLVKTMPMILHVWEKYINMELSLGNINEARAVYKRCYSKRLQGNDSEVICESWLQFEREYGSLDDLDQATKKAIPRLKELKAFQAQEDTNPKKASKNHLEPNKEKAETVEKSKKQSKQKKRKASIGYKNENIQHKYQRGLEGNAIPLKAAADGDEGVSSKEDNIGEENNHTHSASEENVDQPKNVSKQTTYRDQCTAFISNLSLQATEQHLHQFFRDTGGVQAIRLLKDRFTGKSRGLAYIDFEDERKLSAAVGKNKSQLLGKQISIARSNPEDGRKKKEAREHDARGQGGQQKAREESKITKPLAPPTVSHRRASHIQLSGSNTFAVPRNVARSLTPDAQLEEKPKSNDEFRKMLFKS